MINQQAPTVIGEHHGHGAFTYIPDEDPARSKLKHGNDWGPTVVGTPDDHGKPAGYAQFFNERLKSPEQLSATLSEFGLNSKDGGAINDLAAKCVPIQKLMEQKYNHAHRLDKITANGSLERFGRHRTLPEQPGN